jgi:two-component system nitrogen regulation response regulator NtrX
MAHSILVVDDDQAALNGLVELLKSAGYASTGSRNFDEAVHVLAATKPDLLVADIRLGEYNGLHLLLRSRASHPGMASIVISGHPDPALQREATAAGASAFLIKPLKLSEFLTTVARVLGERP